MCHNQNLSAISKNSLRRRYGRIIRTRPDRPLALAEDADRRAVMVMGPSGLRHILDKPGYEMLHSIGHSHAYIERKLKEGFTFELLIFPFDRAELKTATWKNTLKVVRAVYPEISGLIDVHGDRLRREPLETFEAEAGFSFAEVDNHGQSDPRYLTLARLLADPGLNTAADLRRFLFHTVRLSELFTGDGYTKRPDGRRGVREYIVANRPVSSLKSYRLIPLNVTLPDAAAQ